MFKQLTLNLTTPSHASFENFFVGKNQETITHLKNAAALQGDRFIYCWGSQGVGRSHLLQACCQLAGDLHVATTYLPLQHFTELSPEIFEGLEALPLVCIDDVNSIAKHPAWEEALFHFYNRMREKNHYLIVTANQLPQEIGFSLADLSSRLSWGLTLYLHDLSDAEKLTALQKHAKKRGLTLSKEVSEFLLNHWPRDNASLFNALEILDKASLSAQRKLTIPFVKTILKI